MSDINVTNNAQESFCEAVDWIVTDAIARHPSDITLDGVITDVSKKANYRYRVKTTEAEFDAYALEGTNYHKNDSVLIHVPMGNFNNQKTILGRKSDGDAVNEIFAFKLPFDDFVALRSLNEEGAIETNRNKAFWANYNSNKYIKNTTNAIENESTLNIEIEQKSTADSLDEILLWQWNYGSSNFGTTIGNTRLGVEADWQTFLGDYNPIAGVYGFHIVVTGRAVNQESVLTKDYFFTNADMYGNTYAFYTPYSQQKVLDISEFCNIHDVKIYFYQDYNFISATTHVDKIWYDDFKLVTENSIEYYVPNMPENILVDNINVFLGITTADIKDEKTYLYSYDPLSYTTIKKRRGIVEGEEHIYIENQNNEWECETTKKLLTEENPTDIQTFYECTSDHDLIFTWVHYAKDEGMTFQVVKNIEDLKKQRTNSNKDTHIFWYVYNYDNEVRNSDLKLFPYQYWDEEEQVYKFHTEETGYHTNYQEFYDNLIDSQENKSYISKIELYGGEGWTFIPSQTDKFNWENFNPRADKSREKIKVVVQHHGTHTISEVMVLNNTRDIEQELAATARNDAFLIKCFKVREVDGKLLAVEDSSLNAFHIYDENNQILHNDQGERYDYEKLYLQIHIKDEDTGTYQLFNTFDEENATNLNRMISWLIPDNCSMIESQYPISPEDAVYFTNNLQFKDEANNVTSVAGDINIDDPSYKNFYAATRRFTIKSILNNRYQNNIVNAIVTYNNEQYYLQKDLMFGRAEGEGHEFVPVIELIQPYNASNIICDEAFMVGCVVYNKDGSIFRPSDTHLLRFEWKELGQHTYFTPTPNSNSEEDIIFTPKLFDEHKNALIGSYSEMVSRLELTQENESLKNKYHRYDNNVICGYIKRGADQAYGYSPIFEVTVSGAADYDITVRKAFPIITYPNNASKEQNYIFTVPTRVEFKSDGVKPVYYDSIFSVQQATDDDNQHEEVFNEIILPQNEKVNTDEFKADEWQLKDNLQEDETRIFILQSKLEDTEILTEETVEDGEETTIIYSPKKKYYYTYQLVPNLLSKDGAYANIDEIKRRISWTPELLSNYYYLVWQKDGMYFTQALAFSRSLYSSSLVNEWDGTTLTWDEENGSILSTMIAAGKKDNHNRFTGVMMGDWSTKGDESLDIPGMYGYKNGAQTFGFKTDGSGFIGEAGKGRIEFDGDKALISNSDKTCYMNLNPGANRGYSDNFIYCQIPKTQNESNFNINQDGIENEASWANAYARDTENDYFIVDPKHGILTTGGLIARYGKLGNWMINNEGLYQTTNNGYMYLGVSALDTDTIVKYNNHKSNIEQLDAEITSAITKLIKEPTKLLANSQDLSEKSIYYDLISRVIDIKDDLEGYPKEIQTLVDESKSLLAEKEIYEEHQKWISGRIEDAKTTTATEEDINFFKTLYQNYINAEDLAYYNLLETLESLIKQYSNRTNISINIEDLKTYLTEDKDTKDKDYRHFIKQLMVQSGISYTISKIKPLDEGNTSTDDDMIFYKLELTEDGLKYEQNASGERISINNISTKKNISTGDSEIIISLDTDPDPNTTDDNTAYFYAQDIIKEPENSDALAPFIRAKQLCLLIQNNYKLKFSEVVNKLNEYLASNNYNSEALDTIVQHTKTYDQFNTKFRSLQNSYNTALSNINNIIDEKIKITEYYKDTSTEEGKTILKQYLQDHGYMAQTDTAIPEKTTINSKIINKFNTEAASTNGINAQNSSIRNLIDGITVNGNKTTEGIKDLYLNIEIKNTTDEIIKEFQNDYQTLAKNLDTTEWAIKITSGKIDDVKLDSDQVENNEKLLEYIQLSLQIINNLIDRQKQLIISEIDPKDFSDDETAKQLYNNSENILENINIVNKYIVDVVEQDIDYIEQIVNFYNNINNAITAKISKITNNSNGKLYLIDNRANEIDSRIYTLLSLLEQYAKETEQLVKNIQVLNEYKNNDDITSLDENINLTDIPTDSIIINYNEIKTVNIVENHTRFYNPLIQIATAIQKSTDYKDQKTQLSTFLKELSDALYIDLEAQNIKIKDTTLNSYINIADIVPGYVNILITVVKEYTGKVTDQTTYAIYVAERDLTSPGEKYDPYFSVSRNGSLFARRGIIANTWTIDDSSLTYEKNSAKIYLGQGVTGNIENYSTNNDWIISAGIIGDDKKYYMNYGVSLDGQLYATRGQIGGWYIDEKMLRGHNHIIETDNEKQTRYLQLNAENNTISMSDSSFIIDGNNATISIGKYETTLDKDSTTKQSRDLVRGTLNLASFAVLGRCELSTKISSDEDMFNFAKTVIVSTKTEEMATGGQTYNYGWGTVQLTDGAIGATTGTSSTNIAYSLLDVNASYLQFLDQNNKIGETPVGAVLATGGNGNKPGEANNKVTVFYPVNSQNNALGATGHRWDVLANYIDAANITSGSLLCTKAIYMNGREKVATEPWVRDQLYDIWNAIGEASSAAGAASRTSNASSITKAEWIGKQGKFGGYSIGLRFTRGNGSTFDSNATGDLSGAYHGHKIDFQFNSGYLQATAAKYSGNGTTTYGGSVNLNHNHELTLEISSAGILTGQVLKANFNSAAPQQTINLEETAWFKKRATELQQAVFTACQQALTNMTITEMAGQESVWASESTSGATINYTAHYTNKVQSSKVSKTITYFDGSTATLSKNSVIVSLSGSGGQETWTHKHDHRTNAEVEAAYQKGLAEGAGSANTN